MQAVFLDCYSKLSVLIAVADILIAVGAFKKNKTTGRFLGFACLEAAVVDISYLVSILTDNDMLISVMSSIYFVSIDIMLVCLLIFTLYYTKNQWKEIWRKAVAWIKYYTLYEIAVFAINPFWEIAVSYERRNTFIAQYSYGMKPLYWMHLLFIYVLVAIILALLIRKMNRLPTEYQRQYCTVILGIVVTVAANAVFQFWPEVTVYSLLNYSIFGYSLIGYLLYWSCFRYATYGMLNSLKSNIFESIGQGIVLFDCDDNLILYNKRAKFLLGDERLKGDLKTFKKQCGMVLNPQEVSDSFSLQCYIDGEDGVRPLRCDARRLKNKKEQVLGKLFVFSDVALETDLLTGFQTWESFQKFARENPENFLCPMAAVICDINSLSVINSTYGHQVGDQKIKLLADVMREVFPETTYYVRGHEANLIALCSCRGEAEIQKYVAQIKGKYPDNIQYGISVATDENPDILASIHIATQGMKAKKLLDQESVHFNVLTSLIRALGECDKDTENHVKRTQKLGAELGKRIGLTDMEQSNLLLLCLMHDIGKIGIPQEIINKPGRLSEEEWKIVRSHSEKGYRIACSNHELKDIADAILHHHERWDGEGYPDGLSRESIPVLSRVIAVVDAYDAITNDRPYRQAMTYEEAVAEMKQCAGSQFDPYIVSEFLQMLEEQAGTQPRESLSVENKAPEKAAHFREKQTQENLQEQSVHTVCYSRYIVDENTFIVSIDKNFEKITGYTMADFAQKPFCQMDLIPEKDRMEYLCQLNAGLANSPHVFLEHRIRRKDGTDIYVFCFGRLYYDSAVGAERSEIIITDITDSYSMKMLSAAEESRAQVRLQYWESTYRRDSLTGLLNHAAFRSDVEMKLLEEKTKVMMLMLDVDKFKEYNDTYGHHAGDQFLVLVGQALLSSLRREDCAGRMGGDEFAMALFFDKKISDAQMYKRAQQIFDKVTMTLRSVETGAGISMGAAIAGGEIRTFNQLYKASDKALYLSKESGRGRLTVV